MRASWVVGLAAALCSTTALAQVNDNIGPINIQPPKNFSQSVIQSPPAQALSVDADLLPIIQPSATPTLRKITPANLLGSSGFAYANACNPVVIYGADPTGAHSANEAINHCNGTQRNGQYVNTFLPGGTYRLTGPINISNGQCLVVEPGLTMLSVGYDFSPSATGVLVIAGGGAYGGASVPCIKGDPIIVFDQPADIGSRANFDTLGNCGGNGKGCQYPPGINFNGAQRFDIEGVIIANAWDCIKGDGSNVGDGNDRWGIIRCGAYHHGLDLSGIKDVIHIDGFYFWPYGMTVDNNANVYQDGATVAASLAEVDGFDVDLFFSLGARVILNSSSGWFHFKNLMLDTNNATLQVLAAQWAKVASGYATGGQTAGANCGIIENASGSVSLSISNFEFINGTIPIICNAGVMNLSNSTIAGQTNSQSMVAQTGGTLILTGNYIAPIAAGPWTAPIIDVTGGSLVMTGNEFAPLQTSGTAIHLGVDSAKSMVIGNDLNGWAFSYSAQPVGTYWPNKLNSAGDTGSAYVRNGIVTADLDAVNVTASTQFLARGYTNPNLKAWLGIDTTDQAGVLQAYKQGTGPLTFYINPLGGDAIFGAAMKTTGANAAVVASSVAIDFTGGAGRLLSYGADASTYGLIQFATIHGDGSGAVVPAQITSTGMEVSRLTINAIPSSAGGGGLFVCIDSVGVTYQKATCP